MNGKTNVSEIVVNNIETGARIPLEAPVLLSAARDVNNDTNVYITWSDPVDKVASPGGELVAAWNSSTLIRKKDSPPENIDDGMIILTSSNRNEHQVDAFVDVVDNEGVNYYGVFSDTSYGVDSPLSNIIKVNDYYGSPKYDSVVTSNLSLTSANYPDSVAHAGQYMMFCSRSSSGPVSVDPTLTMQVLTKVGDYSIGATQACCTANVTFGTDYIIGGGGTNTWYGQNGLVRYDSALVGSSMGTLPFSTSLSAASLAGNHIIIVQQYNETGNVPAYTNRPVPVCAISSEYITTQLEDYITTGQNGTSHKQFAISAGRYSITGAIGDDGNRSLAVYDNELTKISGLNDYTNYRHNAATITMPGYGIVAGGAYYNSSPEYETKTVFAYDSELIKYDLENLRNWHNWPGRGRLGEFAIIGGGNTGGGNNYEVEYYDRDLIKYIADDLPGSGISGNPGVPAGPCGEYFIFIGYYSGHSTSDPIPIVKYNLKKGTE